MSFAVNTLALTVSTVPANMKCLQVSRQWGGMMGIITREQHFLGGIALCFSSKLSSVYSPGGERCAEENRVKS